MKRKCLALFMGVMVLFCGTGALKVSANTLSPTINGISFSAYSIIDASSANAGTVSGSPYLQVSVSSTYTYLNVKNLSMGTIDYGELKDNADGKQGVTVSFSAPAYCKSSAITSNHTAESGTETWSGKTSAAY